MCIIVIKPAKKAFPADAILKECFRNNPDGAGIMYPDGDSVVIQKGLMTYEEFITALNAIPAAISNTVVLHFRIGTHGKKSPANTHPFPLSGDYEELQKLQNRCSRALVHNGIMSQYGDKNASLSDSAFFAKMLSGLKTDRAIRRALTAHISGGKFVVLSPDALIRIGDFTKYKGCFFSNTSFRITEFKMPVSVVTNDQFNRFYGGFPKHATPDKWSKNDKQTLLDQELTADEKYRQYIEELNVSNTF